MIGVDVVEVERFRSMLDRSPGMLDRFFSSSEIAYCDARPDPIRHLAGTFAAKEAVMKALSLVPAVAWARRIEITRAPSGAPVASVNDVEVPVSISHDGPVAVAVALGRN